MNKNIVLFIIYIIFVLIISLLILRKPEYNWDILPYTASVYSLESRDTAAVHQRTYETVKSNFPSQAYELLITNNNYREAMYTCPSCFYQQLPFYRIRPLYVLSIYLLYKLNLNIVLSTFAISGASYFLICIIVFIWLRSFLKNTAIVFILSLLLAASPYLFNAASEASPNILSAMIVLGAVFSYYVKRIYLFLALLLLSLFARPDNLILVILFACVLLINKGEVLKIKKVYVYSFILISIIIFFLINKWSGNYDWRVWYDHTFKERIISPASYIPQFDISFYFKSFLKWAVLFKMSFIGIQLLLFLSVLYMRSVPLKEMGKEPELLMLCAAVLSIFIHYFIYPVMDDKYFIAQYLLIDIFFLKLVFEKFSAIKEPAVVVEG